jgi:hypothetical protein
VSSNGEKEVKPDGQSLPDSYRLHFTVLERDTPRWQDLATQLGVLNEPGDIIVSVRQCQELREESQHYALEKVSLYYDDDKHQNTVRSRLFRYEGVATKTIVPPISEPEPARPYAEIIWSNGSVAKVRICGLDNPVSRGCSIAREAVSLAQAVDVLLNLSFDSLESLRVATSKKIESNESENKRGWSEQEYTARVIPAAMAVGMKGDELSDERVSENIQPRISRNSASKYRKLYPETWKKAKDAHAEGLKQRHNSAG